MSRPRSLLSSDGLSLRFTEETWRRVPRVERVAIVGALALSAALLVVANVLGGWFVSRFWVWATPVAAAYWGS